MSDSFDTALRMGVPARASSGATKKRGEHRSTT